MNKWKRTTVNFDEATYNDLRILACANNQSISSLVQNLIKEYLVQFEKEMKVYRETFTSELLKKP